MLESEVNATTPSTAADIAPAVSVEASLWARSGDAAATFVSRPTCATGRIAFVRGLHPHAHAPLLIDGLRQQRVDLIDRIEVDAEPRQGVR